LEQRSDTDLVMAARRGERSAYAGLVERHYGQVFLVCLGVLGNVHDAEDAAQDALIKGFEQIRRLREAGQFSGWIVTIARNLSINLLRKRKTAARAVDAERLTPRPREAPARDDLEQAIARLPRDLRTPLVMYYFNGQKVKTVAHRLDMSPSGVYLKLRSAIKELHEIMTTQGDIR
jgi:RNA polymerase sigma-70 factor (ECF subfamily)